MASIVLPASSSSPERRLALTGLILAGGAGQRMGGLDKGLQRLGELPLIRHVCTRLMSQVDTLLICAIIEARSCERFAVLAPELDEELGQFYTSLLLSEMRHFGDYLKLAVESSSKLEVDQRLPLLLECERNLIEAPDAEFRFHSGVPVVC